jgi:opacity protein-like surface antigen
MKLATFLSAVVLAMPLASSSLAASTPQPVIGAAAEHQSRRANLTARAVDITTQYGQALFVKDNWEVKIFRDGDRFIYSGGENGKRGIRLVNGKLIKSGGKHFYKWHNAGTIYQVTWQPADPDFARVQVFDLGGSEIFNKLMWTPTGD